MSQEYVSLPEAGHEGALLTDGFVRHEVFGKSLLNTAPYQSLLQLSEHFYLFSISIPYVFGGMTDKVWFDLSAAIRRELPLFFWKSKVPLFSGFELLDADWNYVLFASLLEFRFVIEEFLLSVVFHDVSDNRVSGFGLQTLEVQDTLLLPVSLSDAVQPQVPTVSVVAFGINGSDRRVAFRPLDRRRGIPSVFSTYGDPEMATYVRQLQQGHLYARRDETEFDKRRREEHARTFAGGQIIVPEAFR